MDEKFVEQLKQEGYAVWERDGHFLLVDLIGEFVDSRHQDLESLVRYCEQNVFTFLD